MVLKVTTFNGRWVRASTLFAPMATDVNAASIPPPP